MAGKKNFRTSAGERTSYGLYFFGQNIFYVFFYMYLQTYLLDVGILAYAVSAVLLVVKIWDAVNDPLFGGIVDKVRFKSSKFVPWLRISLIFIPITSVLMFAINPNWSHTFKIVWALVAYVLWDTAYTICDVPIFGLVTTMTDDQDERTSLQAIGRVCAQLAAIIVGVGIPVIREAIGGWFTSMFVLSIVAVITMVPICFTAKERVLPETEGEDNVSIKMMFSYLGHNKFLLIFYIGLFISYGANIQSGLSLIFARQIYKSESVASILSLVGIVPAIIVGIFVPMICKKVDKFKLFFWANIANAVLTLVQYFIGFENQNLFLALTFLRGLPLGVFMVTMYMFTPDCAEYGRYKTGISAPGVTFSIQTFAIKLMTAVTASLGTLALGVIGYIEKEGAVQPEMCGSITFNQALWNCYMLIPVAGMLLSIPVFMLYKLNDKDVQIMAKCNAGEITKKDAERQLSRRY